MTAIETLARGLARLGLPSDDGAMEKFFVYLRELEKWNPLFGLVGAEGRELVVRHFLDSLAGAGPILERRPKLLADIGSGAGFPGIPLAVFLAGARMTLVEPSQKRCAFLRSTAALMGLANLRVFEGGLELVRETYDCVTFRAFRPLDRKTLRLLRGILAPGGAVAAYKGRIEKFEAEIAAARDAGLQARIVPLEVPFLDEPRHLVWLSIPPAPESL